MKGMRSPSFELSHRTTFEQPCAAVFALLSDPRLRPRWQRSLRSVELIDAGEPRLGMRWQERPHGLMTFELQITAYEPERLWAEQFTCRIASGTLELRFIPEGSASTRVDVRAVVNLHGPARAGSRVAALLLRREMTGDLALAQRALAVAS
jgi:uncharacterized protein YndB with AHSA1/START domain